MKKKKIKFRFQTILKDKYNSKMFGLDILQGKLIGFLKELI